MPVTDLRTVRCSCWATCKLPPGQSCLHAIRHAEHHEPDGKDGPVGWCSERPRWCAYEPVGPVRCLEVGR